MLEHKRLRQSVSTAMENYFTIEESDFPFTRASGTSCGEHRMDPVASMAAVLYEKGSTTSHSGR